MHKRKSYVEYDPNLSEKKRKKRVAAYARVSGDRDEAFHSLSAQISYFHDVIKKHPDWEFVDVYSDRGITGTKENRPGFQKMLAAARAKEIDLILAKSITRFARNTVILLETVRELRSIGVGVYFEEENIDTLSEKGEFMISILAARAQEESRSASENQKWRIRKAYAKGRPVTGNCLGYRMVDHQFLIDDEEEELVLRIFSMYLSGMGVGTIAKKLTDEGVKTRFGHDHWSPFVIRSIIRNEKYQGDLVLQKSYITDHITKKEAKNNGELPKYVIKDAHDPIIDRETFEKVQTEIKRRAESHPKGKCMNSFPFSKMIVCGRCNAHYKHKYNAAGTKYQKPIWICCTFDQLGKKYCNSQFIPEDILTNVTCKTLGLESLENVDLHDYLQMIRVPDNNTLVYVFKDGTEKKVDWAHVSRSKSWTPEMKEVARKRAIEQHKRKKEMEAKKNGSQSTS